MAILKQCPGCRKRCSADAKECPKCGKNLSKLAGLNWWIAYYDINKRLIRKKIGPSRAAAEQEERRHLTAKAEKRCIKVSQDATTTFKELANWYLELETTKDKSSYRRDVAIVRQLVAYFGDKLLAQINRGMVENYRQHRSKTIKPSTVNRECACLQTIFSTGIKHERCENNPCVRLGKLEEDNIRDRILSDEEYIRLLAACPNWLKPIVAMGFYTGMRKGEILGLTWDDLDLREGFVYLKGENTKTKKSRTVPLAPELVRMLSALPRGLKGKQVKVFCRSNGKPVTCIRAAFTKACREANVENFVFHDFRHTAINNWRLAGHDYFRIMAASGHRSMKIFRRYNSVSLDELKALVGGGKKA
jgi:integrase